MDVLFLFGRILFSFLFLMGGVGHFMRMGQMAQYTQSMGVPMPKLAVGGTGVLLLLGGASVLLGFYPTVGLILLIVFLVPTNLIMHRFWGLKDSMQQQMQMTQFNKNLALTGAALMMLVLTQLLKQRQIDWLLSLGGW